MKISSVIAYKKENGKVIFAEGIVDCYSDVQVIVPRDIITSNDLDKMFPYDRERFNKSTDSQSFNFGEHEAKDSVGDYDLFEIKIVEIEIPDNISQY